MRQWEKNEDQETYFKLLWQLQLGKKFIWVLYLWTFRELLLLILTEKWFLERCYFLKKKKFTVSIIFCLNILHETFLGQFFFFNMNVSYLFQCTSQQTFPLSYKDSIIYYMMYSLLSISCNKCMTVKGFHCLDFVKS